jgi:hypothetical protein
MNSFLFFSTYDLNYLPIGMYLRENRGSLKDLIAAMPLKTFFFIHCLLPFSSQEETRD